MRDIASEMRKHLDAAMVGDYRPREAAQTIVDHLREHDPGLLLEYLGEEAVTILADRMRRLNHAARTGARNEARRSVFADAAAEFERADTPQARATGAARLVDWLDGVHCRLHDGTFRLLGDCTGADLDWQIDDYQRRANRERFEASWLQAIARVAGDRPVRERLSNEQLTLMRSNSSIDAP